MWVTARLNSGWSLMAVQSRVAVGALCLSAAEVASLPELTVQPDGPLADDTRHPGWARENTILCRSSNSTGRVSLSLYS